MEREDILGQIELEPVTNIKGVGTETAELLNELGIYHIHDLIMYFPYRYEDFRLKDLAETPHNEQVTIEARVEGMPVVFFTGRK